MKIKDKKSLHNKTIKELNDSLIKEKEMLYTLMLDKSQNKLKNPRQLSIKRKDIAVMLTIKREKELVEESKKKANTKAKI